MPTLTEFNAQLNRCAQSPEEVRDFVEGFSKVRLRYIARAMAHTLPIVELQPGRPVRHKKVPLPIAPDWSDGGKLAESGHSSTGSSHADPGADWLHVDVAMDLDSPER